MQRVYRLSPSKKKNIFSGMSWNTRFILINVVAFVVIFPLLVLEAIPIEFVALRPANILQGQFLWTFLTSMFMHGGLFHLFVNMLSMFFIGSLVEKLLGTKRFVGFYLLSGLFAGLFFVLVAYFFQTDLEVFAVGASGALFGLVGLLTVLTPNLPVYVMFIPIPMKMKYAAPGLLLV